MDRLDRIYGGVSWNQRAIFDVEPVDGAERPVIGGKLVGTVADVQNISNVQVPQFVQAFARSKSPDEDIMRYAKQCQFSVSS